MTESENNPKPERSKLSTKLTLNFLTDILKRGIVFDVYVNGVRGKLTKDGFVPDIDDIQGLDNKKEI